MAVKSFFIPQGLVIAEVTENSDTVIAKNPALIITRQNEVILAPLLHLVEENTVSLKLDEIVFKCVFTPKRELVNHYNQMFGSGLVLTTSMP